MKHYLRAERNKNAKGYIGFKWKIFHNAMLDRANYSSAVKYLADARIPVIHMTRNYLDVAISVHKHAVDLLASHCIPTDTQCIHKHKITQVKMNPTHVIKFMVHNERFHLEAAKILAARRIPHMSFVYEDLAFGKPKTQLALLQQLLDLMYPGSNKKASLELLETKLAVTSDRDQSHAVQNYDELIAHLEGTRFASQLRGTAGNGTKIEDF
jgi:hypothetical protein